MPQRFLRPGITHSERWNALPFDAQSFFVRLLTVVDDFGRFDARIAVLHAQCFALRPDVAPPRTAAMRAELAAAKMIEVYEVDGREYLQMTQWQERARAARSKYPDPPQTLDFSTSAADRSGPQRSAADGSVPLRNPASIVPRSSFLDPRSSFIDHRSPAIDPPPSPPPPAPPPAIEPPAAEPPLPAIFPPPFAPTQTAKPVWSEPEEEKGLGVDDQGLMSIDASGRWSGTSNIQPSGAKSQEPGAKWAHCGAHFARVVQPLSELTAQCGRSGSDQSGSGLEVADGRNRSFEGKDVTRLECLGDIETSRGRKGGSANHTDHTNEELLHSCYSSDSWATSAPQQGMRDEGGWRGEQSAIRTGAERQNSRSEPREDGVIAAAIINPQSAIAFKPVWSEAKGWENVSEGMKAEWKEAYPACDIERQLAAMTQWLKANPARAKKSNWLKFMTNWLSRSQDKGGDLPPATNTNRYERYERTNTVPLRNNSNASPHVRNSSKTWSLRITRVARPVRGPRQENSYTPTQTPPIYQPSLRSTANSQQTHSRRESTNTALAFWSAPVLWRFRIVGQRRRAGGSALWAKNQEPETPPLARPDTRPHPAFMARNQPIQTKSHA